LCLSATNRDEKEILGISIFFLWASVPRDIQQKHIVVLDFERLYFCKIWGIGDAGGQRSFIISSIENPIIYSKVHEWLSKK
jgi:hypothetical protein